MVTRNYLHLYDLGATLCWKKNLRWVATGEIHHTYMCGDEKLPTYICHGSQGMLKTKSISNAQKKKPGCDQMIGNGPVLHKGPKKNILKTQGKNCEGRAQFWQAAFFFCAYSIICGRAPEPSSWGERRWLGTKPNRTRLPTVTALTRVFVLDGRVRPK